MNKFVWATSDVFRRAKKKPPTKRVPNRKRQASKFILWQIEYHLARNGYEVTK